jgi:hypothetical protein
MSGMRWWWVVVAVLGGSADAWGEELDGPYPQELAQRPLLIPEGAFEGRFVLHAGRVPADEFLTYESFTRLFASARAKVGFRKVEMQGGVTGFLIDLPRQPRSLTPADRVYAGFVAVRYEVSPSIYLGASLSVLNHEIVNSDDIREVAPRVSIGKRWRGERNAAELHGFAGANYLYVIDAEKIPVVGATGCVQLGLSNEVAIDAAVSLFASLDNSDSELHGVLAGDLVLSPSRTVDLRVGVSYGDAVIVSLGIDGRYLPRGR